MNQNNFVDVKLKRLTFKNFKGLRDLTVDLNEDITNIFGDNATGKTTINDGFRYLLFGKDSTDRKEFSIKPFDSNNNVEHGVECTVTGEFLINGRVKTFEKSYKEKWVKPRGRTEEKLQGHETLCKIDEVPEQVGEFQKQVALILDEQVFKLLTDPLFFSTKIPWQERRKTLLDITGNLTSQEVIDSNIRLKNLADLLNEDTTVEKLKKKVADKKKRLNDEIKAIPTRIDECNNSIKEVDVKSLTAELDDKTLELSTVEEDLLDLTKPNPSVTGRKNELNQLQAKINIIEVEAQTKHSEKLRELQRTLRSLKNEKGNLDGLVLDNNMHIQELTQRIDEFSEEIKSASDAWDMEKAKEFQFTDDCICPTCGRKLEAKDIEKKKSEMEEKFNTVKAKELDRILERSKSLITQKESAKDDVKQLKSANNKYFTKISELEKQIPSAEKEIIAFEKADVNYPDKRNLLKAEVVRITEELTTVKDFSTAINELKSKKGQLVSEIDSLKDELRQEDTNKKQRSRIDELKAEERKLAQQIADLEKQEFLCEEFTKTEAELLGERINSMFKYVRFKLFNKNINGGIEPTCEALVNGVPFADANNAGKVNAGIDIINTLSEFYGVSAPIFIDNREAINEIIPTKAQVINLVVAELYTDGKEIKTVSEWAAMGFKVKFVDDSKNVAYLSDSEGRGFEIRRSIKLKVA